MNVGVLLINWNTPAELSACIQSLIESTVVPEVIVVWDNDSQDPTCGDICMKFPGVRLINSPQNIGFADACNQGSVYLIELGVERIWLLNSDTVVDKHCLEELCKCMQEYEDAVAVTGLIMDDQPSPRVWYGGGRFKGLIQEADHLYIGEKEEAVPKTVTPTDFLTGCCILVSSDTLMKHGLFNPHYFAYVEDADWSFRLRKQKCLFYFTPKAILTHAIGASMHKKEASKGKVTPFQHFQISRNRLWFLKDHHSNILLKWTACAWIILRCLRFAMYNVLLGRFEKTSAIMKGIHQGLTQMPKPDYMLDLDPPPLPALSKK